MGGRSRNFRPYAANLSRSHAIDFDAERVGREKQKKAEISKLMDRSGVVRRGELEQTTTLLTHSLCV
ncbi:MAG: hypothetical protein Q7T57_05170, partial [Dehalococcoidales bacterium]|nr:hypothetical protein [Dehalococcoidales bacterium]